MTPCQTNAPASAGSDKAISDGITAPSTTRLQDGSGLLVSNEDMQQQQSDGESIVLGLPIRLLPSAAGLPDTNRRSINAHRLIGSSLAATHSNAVKNSSTPDVLSVREATILRFLRQDGNRILGQNYGFGSDQYVLGRAGNDGQSIPRPSNGMLAQNGSTQRGHPGYAIRGYGISQPVREVMNVRHNDTIFGQSNPGYVQPPFATLASQYVPGGPDGFYGPYSVSPNPTRVSDQVPNGPGPVQTAWRSFTSPEYNNNSERVQTPWRSFSSPVYNNPGPAQPPWSGFTNPQVRNFNHPNNFGPSTGSAAPVNPQTGQYRYRQPCEEILQHQLGISHTQSIRNGLRELQARNSLASTATNHPPAPHPPTPGVSSNYLGNPMLQKNQSADIPEEENCSFWITNLPPDVTYSQILANIRNIGRVYAVHINTPSGEFPTSAAKVVFFDRDAAERFWIHTREWGFPVGLHVGVVRKNRIKTAPQHGVGERSRVIHVYGPKDFVHQAWLLSFFSGKCTYQMEEIITHPENFEMEHVEFRFASYRCQAEAAWAALERVFGAGPGSPIVKWWGDDPCDVPGGRLI